MCSVCYKDLIEAYKFREDFLKVQATFKIKFSKENKTSKSTELTEATEFVQVFIVKEEKGISVDDNVDAYGEHEEKEINIIPSKESEKKQNVSFDKESLSEVNALEIKPNEVNTLKDKRSDNVKFESSLTIIDDNSKISKTVSDNDVEYPDCFSGKDSDEESRPVSSKSSPKKCKQSPKTKKTLPRLKLDYQTDPREKSKAKNVTSKSRRRRKDAEEKPNIFICDQCGNHFTCRHHFKLHLRRHSGDKRCACELCPDKFFTSSELRRHMRRHTGERPFACKYCDRKFTDYSTRIKHERTHTNERPFMCSQCGKSFTTSYILKNHMLTHTGERHFKCDVCRKAFTRRTHLVVHFRSIMHKQAVEKDKIPISQEVLTQTHCLLPQSTHIPSFLV